MLEVRLRLSWNTLEDIYIQKVYTRVGTKELVYNAGSEIASQLEYFGRRMYTIGKQHAK